MHKIKLFIRDTQWGFIIIILPLFSSVIVGCVLGIIGHKILAAILMTVPFLLCLIFKLFIEKYWISDR